jgi:hypothetical protein
VALLSLNLSLHRGDGVGGLHVNGIGVFGKGLLSDHANRGVRCKIVDGFTVVNRRRIPSRALVRRLVVLRIETNTSCSQVITFTHPVAIAIKKTRRAHLARLQRLGRVVDGATVFRVEVSRLVTDAKLTGGVTSSLPRAVVVVFVGNAAVAFFQLSSIVVSGAALRRPVVHLCVADTDSVPRRVELADASVVASISLSDHTDSSGGCCCPHNSGVHGWCSGRIHGRMLSGISGGLCGRLTSLLCRGLAGGMTER